jgi:hypothetical protein
MGGTTTAPIVLMLNPSIGPRNPGADSRADAVQADFSE